MGTRLNKQLTSVHVNQDLFEEFKVESIRTKLNFQKLADRAMFLYLRDPEFKSLIHSTNETELM